MSNSDDLNLARGLAIEQAAQLAKKWRHKAVTSREEAGVIRRTVYVATDAESNCQIRAEVWDGCADELDKLASTDAAQALAAHDADHRKLVGLWEGQKLELTRYAELTEKLVSSLHDYMKMASDHELVQFGVYGAAKDAIEEWAALAEFQPAPAKEGEK